MAMGTGGAARAEQVPARGAAPHAGTPGGSGRQQHERPPQHWHGCRSPILPLHTKLVCVQNLSDKSLTHQVIVHVCSAWHRCSRLFVTAYTV
jgi:hypothetical protein